MKFESVKDAEDLLKIGSSDCDCWRTKTWAVFVGRQLSEKIANCMVISVFNPNTWETLYPYFRMEGPKELARFLALYMMGRLAGFEDAPSSREAIEGVLGEMGKAYGEVLPDEEWHAGPSAAYCEIDTVMLREAMDRETARKREEASVG